MKHQEDIFCPCDNYKNKGCLTCIPGQDYAEQMAEIEQKKEKEKNYE